MDNVEFGGRIMAHLAGSMDGLVSQKYLEAVQIECDDDATAETASDPARVALVLTGVLKCLRYVNDKYGRDPNWGPKDILTQVEECGKFQARLMEYVDQELPDGAPRCVLAEVLVALSHLESYLLK